MWQLRCKRRSIETKGAHGAMSDPGNESSEEERQICTSLATLGTFVSAHFLLEARRSVDVLLYHLQAQSVKHVVTKACWKVKKCGIRKNRQ